jgi:carboxymethylenebutenolidase
LGYSALAIDYYGRTAGQADGRSSDFPFMEHLMRVTRVGLEADFAAAVEFLRSPDGGRSPSVFALGFCFGGRQAFLAATLGHRLAGVIGFYGFPGPIMGAPGPTARADQMDSQVLAIWAGGDEIGPDQIQAFLDAMSRHGVAHQSVIYPGAPHGFFDIKQTDWKDASSDAWSRVCAFLDQHSVSRTV